MLPSASVLASRREERVQKAVSVVHHGPGDARLSGVLNPLSHAECDYVAVWTCIDDVDVRACSVTSRNVRPQHSYHARYWTMDMWTSPQ